MCESLIMTKFELEQLNLLNLPFLKYLEFKYYLKYRNTEGLRLEKSLLQKIIITIYFIKCFTISSKNNF